MGDSVVVVVGVVSGSVGITETTGTASDTVCTQYVEKFSTTV